MGCRVRYLNSAGVHPREAHALERLADAMPSDWLLYASFQFILRQETRPLEIDAMLVTDDRVLLIELKDWNGELTADGDQWYLGDRRQGRSAVDTVNLKAKKVATFLGRSIGSGWNGKYLVDARVVLSGSATKAKLDPSERRFVLSLDEACGLGDAKTRGALLSRTTMMAKKPLAFETEFDRVTRNPKLVQPKEVRWGGFRATDTDVVVHPHGLWREHQGERARDPRSKTLIRVWSFDRLPPGLNSSDRRRFVAERELRAIARLEALNSKLVPEGVLMPLGEDPDEILTQHYELRRLPIGWVTLDRYLERSGEALTPEDRKILSATLVNGVAELHANGITHRDLGPRCIWVGDVTRQALTGLMACQMPDEPSAGEWLEVLRGHRDVGSTAPAPGELCDVQDLGRLVLQIFTGRPQRDPATAIAALPSHFAAQKAWLVRALADDTGQRFGDAREAAAALGEALDAEVAPRVDHALLDTCETDVIPYVRWAVGTTLSQSGGKHVYRSTDPEAGEIVVKVWLGWRRGGPLASELALVRLMRGVARIRQAHRADLPRYVASGLSGAGAFVAYAAAKGQPWTAETESTFVAVRRCAALLRAVEALHALEIEHLDLSARNVLVRGQTDVILLDLLDYSGVADGRVSGELRPPNAELLAGREIDRYAALTLVEGCLAPWREVVSGLLAEIQSELARERIELLLPLIERMDSETERLTAPSRPRKVVFVAGATQGPLEAWTTPLFVRAFRTAQATEYVVTGPNRELRVLERPDGLAKARVSATTFKSLAHASEHGSPLHLDIELSADPEDTARDLVSLLKFCAPAVEVQIDPDTLSQPSTLTASFNVPAYWRKLLELEEEYQPTVQVTREISTSEAVASYVYERQGIDFDFDPEDQVDVRFLGGPKIGELDLGLTDGEIMTVRHLGRRRLAVGDRVVFAERRSRTSFDRRRKAADRILKGEGALKELIEYFSPGADAKVLDYGVDVPSADLDAYKLNDGQRAAFRHVARYGPVALQQGPPGTGKTRFIAAFVHWLLTKQGVGKILIASQSHEAVNNAIEALLDLFHELGGPRPSLLRLGSKGLTDKIRPYHTRSLRERYQVRFDAAVRHRIGAIASAMGVRRAFAQEAADLDRGLGDLVRRVLALEQIRTREAEQSGAEERRRDDRALHTARSALRANAAAFLGEDPPDVVPETLLALALNQLRERHLGVTDRDLRKTLQIIEIAREWSASLASSHRNFEEFLAKTRAVVTATCVGAGQTKIRIDTKTFDWVIVDEAARCTSSELAVPAQVGQRLLLVGDHLQLKPMIDTRVLRGLKEEMPGVAVAELSRSDFERAFTSAYGRENGRAFDEQYRMAPEICTLVSKVFYKPHNVELGTSRQRQPSPHFFGLPSPLDRPVVWVDTSDAPSNHDRHPPWSNTTFWNQAERDAVLRILGRVAAERLLIERLAEGPEETPIGVICMYSAQKIMLEKAFSERPWDPRFRRLVRIDTVDSYQGKENTIIVLSLVRNNPERDPGHVASFNRCNVAMSRAKERLFIVGSASMWTATSSNDPMRLVHGHFLAGGEGTVLLTPEAFS